MQSAVLATADLSVRLSVSPSVCRVLLFPEEWRSCGLQCQVIYLGMWPATQVNSAWPSLRG